VKAEAAYLSIPLATGPPGDLPQRPSLVRWWPAARILLTLLDPANGCTCRGFIPQGDLGRCAWGTGPIFLDSDPSQPLQPEWWRLMPRPPFTP